MKLPMRKNIEEVAQMCGITNDVIFHYIQEEWVHPIDKELKMLDEEDVCRIILIQDLQNNFGVNEEAVPVILHLIDQLHFIVHNTEGRHS